MQNWAKPINYFDDLEVKSVSLAKSRVNGSTYSVKDFYGLGLILGNGSVKRFESGKEYHLAMPFLYLIYPGINGSWGVLDGVERENRWFILSGARAERIVNSLKTNRTSDCPTIRLYDARELVEIHQKMLRLYRCSTPSTAYRLAVCVEEFVGTFYDTLMEAKWDTQVARLISKTISEIAANPGAMYNFADLARRNNISYDHFRRCFQKYTGKPIHAFLLQKRQDLAVSLLQESRDNIKEISFRCGFQLQSDFARFIKSRTGMTPSELRQRPVLDSFFDK